MLFETCKSLHDCVVAHRRADGRAHVSKGPRVIPNIS